MIEWNSAFGYTPAPTTSLIAAILLQGFGVRLYLCEPPNTVLFKPNGYIAAGCGAAVTNPLYETMFTRTFEFYSPQYILRWISYLMYRAKKGNAWCGGETVAVYINGSENKLEEVSIFDLRDAEAISSQLDFAALNENMVKCSFYAAF